jgi:dolichol-phosphate mannosyltransferase
VVDDCSTDETLKIAKGVADVAVSKEREGQAKGLLLGMNLARFPVIVTIDADLENDPVHIPHLLELIRVFDVVVASRSVIPRVSERFASWTLGRILGVKDVFSNFRAFRKEAVGLIDLAGAKHLEESFW